jgi:hypothetical protein
LGTSSASVNLSFGGGIGSQAIDLSGQSGIPVFQAVSSFDFGSVVVGQRTVIDLTVTNTGTAPINFLSEPVFQGPNASDFCFLEHLGDCPPLRPATLPPGSSLDVPVTFIPGATGPQTAQLVFNTDVPGSPEKIQLTGNGVAMALSAQSGSATVTAGQTASYNLTVSTGSTVSGAVSMSCTGAPAYTTCTATPASFTSAPSSNQTVMVTVSTMPRSTASRFNLHPGWLWSVALAVGVVLVRPRWRGYQGMLLILVLALAGALASCGGSGYSGGGGGGGGTGTPAGTYTITVTASASGGPSSSMPLTLTVQ